VATTAEQDLDGLALDDALNELDRFDAQQARIVELRFFGGPSIDETFGVLKISPATRLGDGPHVALSGSEPDLGMG
jgi:hypothetical protein